MKKLLLSFEVGLFALAALFLALVVALPVLAQCSGGQCSPSSFAPSSFPSSFQPVPAFPLPGPAFLPLLDGGTPPPSFLMPTPAVAAPLAPVATPRYRWTDTPKGNWALLLGEQQVGWLDGKTGEYFTHLGPNQWSDAHEPPIAKPAGAVKGVSKAHVSKGKTAQSGCGCTAGCDCEKGECGCGKTGGLCKPNCTCATASQFQERKGLPTAGEAPKKSPPLFGVEADKIRPGKITRNGREINQRQAFEAISEGQVPDDASRLRLTVIGPETARKAVLTDLASHPSLAPFKDRLAVQDYAPTDWAVSTAGFVTGGNPTVYLQSPTGKVLHRQDDYKGAEKLAEAIRKADPSYKPADDPDLNKSGIKLPFDLSAIPTPVLLGVGLIVLLYFLPRRSS